MQRKGEKIVIDWRHKMLRKIIYLIGLTIRNRRILSRYEFLKNSENWSLSQLKDYQFAMGKKLIMRAYEKSQFYRSKYQSAGFYPQELRNLQDLSNVPIVTKEEILANRDTIQIMDCPEGFFSSETSGSSGTPLLFYKNKDWDAWVNASVFRGYSWYRVKPWERNGYFWGYNTSSKQRIKIRFLDFLQNRFRIFTYDTIGLDNFLNELTSADYLEGYSSAIYQVAKRANDKKDGARYTLKMIKGTSEKIFDNYQHEVEKAFGKKMVSEYGAAEAGIIAFECPRGSLHINMETVILEEIEGMAVVTNLVSDSFPIIRYAIGDAIRLDPGKKCNCGIQHEVILDVLGRVGQVIYGREKQYPSLTLYYVFKNLALSKGIMLNYQAYQRKKGEMDLRIEQSADETALGLLAGEIKKYFGTDLNIKIFPNCTLREPGRKMRDFISEIVVEQ